MAEHRTVKDVMTRAIVTLNEEDSLTAVAEGMEDLGVRHLPVVDDGRLVGLVSQRDLLRLTVSQLEGGAASVRDQLLKASTFVADVMTREVETVSPETSLREVTKILVDTKYGCLPVVDGDGVLVGIVTEHDLLRELLDHLPD